MAKNKGFIKWAQSRAKCTGGFPFVNIHPLEERSWMSSHSCVCVWILMLRFFHQNTRMWNVNFFFFFLVFTGVRPPFTEGVLSGPTLSCCYMAVAASLESWRVLTVPVERMERYFGAVLHTDLVAGLHFMSVWWSTPSVSSPTAASSPNVWCTTDFCRWFLQVRKNKNNLC